MPHRALRLSACLTLMLLSLTARAAVPAFTDFLGTNGVLIMTNGSPGQQKVQVDGRYLQPATANLTNWSLLSTSVLGSLTATSSNTPSFGQLTSSGLTQSFSAGSGTNVILFASLIASNIDSTASGNGTFPYTGLLVTNAGYYQVFGGSYLSCTTTVNLILTTNSVVDTRFSQQSFPVTSGVSATSAAEITGIAYFPANTTVGFYVSTVPAAAVSASHSRIGMNKIDVIGGNSSSGSSSGGSGETNYNASASTTNATRFAIDTGRLGSTTTNLLRTLEAGANITITNQGTNLVFAASGSGSGDVTTSQLLVVSNQVNVASNYFATNIVSLSTSNAVSKPLTNSYVAGLLKLFGLEAGTNVTITPNGTNLVIASSGGGSGGALLYDPDGGVILFDP